MTDEQDRRLALLIDADNAQASVIDGLLEEVASYGTAQVKRIYGDWTRPNLAGWKDVLLRHSIQPRQQFAYTKGKNATDAAMVIDAMDLLHSGRFDGFCLVSSDSDFTPLAARIRESGLKVYGFGEQKTPDAFVAACDKFVFTELLKDEAPGATPPARLGTKELRGDAKLVTLLRKAAADAAGDDGWAELSSVGNTINKRSPQFDQRSYGYAKLSELIKATKLFDIEARILGEGSGKRFYLRDKRYADA
ncbi:MAG TPA: NYN domain-containing protein [Chromatiaceae bacterium]|jgi:uncharacterized LabA/DUF88 family protein|nr:MAG: hypothetical protein N838_27715 [Thiohalocapsa sp. PB-PSB1]QQO55216.1 MAG: NYN domain-containing protein [Thiohalocapsa sp. PB-PSB1]HBG96271.1 NYN domain-containing protein [Chromatiaceae bacterium]HCS92837.1 NYN domain-containing protein [Chromatiaceae bacterium]